MTVTAPAASSFSPAPAPAPAPAPTATASLRSSREEPVLLDSLDDGDGHDFPTAREYPRARRSLPSFVPFQPETFATLKNPWSVHSVIDLFRLFLLEISAAAALMAACGIMAGKLLTRWTHGIQPLWVLGLYLAILTLYLGVVYLAGKGNNSSGLKAALRTLVLCLFILLIPHMVAFLVMTFSA